MDEAAIISDWKLYLFIFTVILLFVIGGAICYALRFEKVNLCPSSGSRRLRHGTMTRSKRLILAPRARANSYAGPEPDHLYAAREPSASSLCVMGPSDQSSVSSGSHQSHLMVPMSQQGPRASDSDPTKQGPSVKPYSVLAFRTYMRSLFIPDTITEVSMSILQLHMNQIDPEYLCANDPFT